MIPRLIEDIVIKSLQGSDKIIIILGARQVGKTTLLKSIEEKLIKSGKKTLFLNCDLLEDKSLVDTTSLTLLSKSAKDIDYLFIDETQNLSNPGLTLKILYDHLKKIRVIASGSSSFTLKNSLSDAMTGRYRDFYLYPFSISEVLSEKEVYGNKIREKKQAELLIYDILLYGLYPEIYLLKKKEEKILALQKIIESYLFKDVLSFGKIKYPDVIKDLTRALSYQIGSEVNDSELAGRLKIDRKTVISYIDILEKSFVITKVKPYSKNPRREIGKNYKVYFLDLGLRNALIGDFNQFEVRGDKGGLWKNFLFIERLKSYAQKGKLVEFHFWRSYGGAEVDFLERQYDTPTVSAYEFKISGDKLTKGAQIFSNKYHLPVKLINKDNWFDFILK